MLALVVIEKNIPNANEFISAANHSRWSGAGYIKRWRELGAAAGKDLSNQGVYFNNSISIRFRVYNPDRRRRDVHNLFHKPFIDGLGDAGLWSDDSQIKFLSIEEAGIDRVNPRIEIVISTMIGENESDYCNKNLCKPQLPCTCGGTGILEKQSSEGWPGKALSNLPIREAQTQYQALRGEASRQDICEVETSLLRTTRVQGIQHSARSRVAKEKKGAGTSCEVGNTAPKTPGKRRRGVSGNKAPA